MRLIELSTSKTTLIQMMLKQGMFPKTNHTHFAARVQF